MDLAVFSDDLHAAAAAISRCASQLESARHVFVSVATAAVPALGSHASDAAGRGSQAAETAAEVVVDDVRHLAAALRVLAQVYARVDATAVAPR
jgi:hypothetical protein